MSGAKVGTWFRTITQLHPLQIGARVPHRVSQALIGVTGIGSGRAPNSRSLVLSSSVAGALKAFAIAESGRYESRMAWLAKNPRLAAYEARYGLAADARGFPWIGKNWSDAMGTAPYVASVRARRLASAIARGESGLLPQLARAARAVFLAPEFHLLGNHLLENGIALVCASAVAEGAEADLWWRMGAAILNWQLPLQFYSDGMHDEGSMTYHLALVAGLIEACALADAAGRAVPPAWTDLVERGLGIARDYEAPGGLYPLFNDAAYDAGPSVAQVCSLAAGCGFHVRDARADAAFTSLVGWVVLRNARAWCVMKAGPDGSGTQPGHVHADLLSIELWVDGVKVISDPGVTSYNDDEARAWCRSGAAHNGPHLEGEDCSEVWGAFRTGRRSCARLESLSKKPLSMRATRTTASEVTICRDCELGAFGLRIRDVVDCDKILAASTLGADYIMSESVSTHEWLISWT